MILETILVISELSAAEKYIVANELWEQVARDEASIPFDEAVGELLKSRQRERQAGAKDDVQSLRDRGHSLPDTGG